MSGFIDALLPLTSRQVVLFGGKGGVGKTSVATAAALGFAAVRPVVLFTSDPASSLSDLIGDSRPDGLTVEALDAAALYAGFLDANLQQFLEIGDRGTYLDRGELQRLLQLSLPGIDELMAWMRIGELAEQRPDAIVIVDTAPTGHTLRMLSSSDHFTAMAHALDAMQEKHRAMVRQFMRREVRDALDEFIAGFEASARRRHELLTDPDRAAFVAVTLSEPLVADQTLRLIDGIDIDVPLVILNRAVDAPDCDRDRRLAIRDAEAKTRFAPRPVVTAARSCTPLDSLEAIRGWSSGCLLPAAGRARSPRRIAPEARSLDAARRILFLAGKGGVGKTTCAAAIALNRALGAPDGQFVVISVDPAHSLRDLFERIEAPPNLTVETIDTKARWDRFRASLGDEISGAIDSLAPRGMSIAHDAEAMEQLLGIAPPGADEIFAITRLAALAGDTSLSGIVVDTAPTGHFLRLLDLPAQAGEWVREFMRLLLRYREVVPPGSLGSELVHASRAFRDLEAALRSEAAAVALVTRPERIVVAESRRLEAELRSRGVAIAGVIANHVTPSGDCACDRLLREAEQEILDGFDVPPLLIERREEPPLDRASLEAIGAVLLR